MLLYIATDPREDSVVQYDMKSSESLGLIKFDFLGLKTLDQFCDALVIIKENHGVDVDMENLPTDILPIQPTPFYKKETPSVLSVGI